MAKLLDPIRLMEKPKNTPMFVEARGVDEMRFKVAWKYDEELHSIFPIGGKVRYDIDGWNKNWRAWDALPTQQERKAQRWLKVEEAR